MSRSSSKRAEPSVRYEGLDNDEVTARLVERFRSLGPCVAYAGNKSVWIAESIESPGYFHIQQTTGRHISYMTRPMKLSGLRFAVHLETGLHVDDLEFRPCEGLLIDELTGRISGDMTVTGLVYFLQLPAGGPIKIGFATDLDRRIRDLQTAHPTVLKVLDAFPGTRGMEHWLHGSLKKRHVRGEWFEDCWEVRSLMRELQRRVASEPTE